MKIGLQATTLDSLRSGAGGLHLPLAALMAAFPTCVWSQGAAGPAVAGLEEVVVTASRVRTGFEAPTPVTTIGIDDIQARGSTNVADYLNEVPSFLASTTPATTALNSRENGSNVLDLRGLGAERTLLLINGRRHVATAPDNTVNINVVPSIALGRVEVVTGGASASWGSDAISGVVNLIPDQELTGFRLEAQGGTSEHGDADSLRLGGVYGHDLGDGRGHALLALEYSRDRGVLNQSDREWGRRRYGLIGNPNDTGPNDGRPARLIAENTNLFFANEGGLILGGPLTGVTFGPGGAIRTNDFGAFNDGNFQVGGTGGNLGQYIDLVVPGRRYNAFFTGHFDINQDLTAFAEASYGNSRSATETVQSFTFPTRITSDNAFISPELRARLTSSNVAGFNLFRLNTDIGFVTADSQTETYRGVIGFRGSLSPAWRWDAYYQHGRTDYRNRQLNNLIVGNFRNAADAVINPATGQPVCRATLTGGAPGCQPINLFGFGSPSRAAIDYVNGVGAYDLALTQDVAAATLTGELFDLGAGKVATAVGIEYRSEKVRSESDALSRADAFLIVNAKPINGSFDVKEAFAEIVAPLLANKPGVDRLELSGAVRATDYTTSGSVTTWKFGGSWSPVADVRFRGTISRDIRAPNLGELFAFSRLSFANVSNPVTGRTDFTRVLTGGNLDLQPEESDGKNFGVVVEPRWISGLRLSADYFDIQIDRAINSLGAQDIVRSCAAGVSSACATITRDAGGTITQVNAQFINVARLTTKGFDVEALYRVPEDSFLALGGQVTLRALVTHVAEKEFSPNGVVVFDRAGEITPNAEPQFVSPKWRGTLTANYDYGQFSGFLQTRFVGSARYDNTFTTEDINDNTVQAEWYVNVGARWRVPSSTAARVEVFLGINNLFDNDPPPAPLNFISPLGTNPAFYDVVGRSFYAGARVGFQ